ncbi:MAG TPA: hypothetical protein VKV02_08665 [Acidobacteriaceae bacterium]|nr:hypothetical protein [Acidobacteriaceae bacterium]
MTPFEGTGSPVMQRIRAYFAPVDRAAQHATIFDPAQSGDFPLDAVPAPWVDLGWISGFARTSATAISALRTGAPASVKMQARTEVEATVKFAFESWGKLQVSLAAGTQQMNLLATQSGAAAAGSGGAAQPAVPLGSGSSATTLNVGATAQFAPGDLVAVDVDYVAGTTGFVGSGVSGAYLKSGLNDVDYIRRVTLNVGTVQSINSGVLTLSKPLLAGAPVAGMKVSSVLGFCDREGSSFFQEWSALFVGEGQQGERVIWHYPRLQGMAGIAEVSSKSAGGYESVRLAGSFRAMPVTDPVDGERVVCFRSYLTRSV